MNADNAARQQGSTIVKCHPVIGQHFHVEVKVRDEQERPA
jgi:hypothetical protein